jgi:hypothetical protein
MANKKRPPRAGFCLRLHKETIADLKKFADNYYGDGSSGSGNVSQVLRYFIRLGFSQHPNWRKYKDLNE